MTYSDEYFAGFFDGEGSIGVYKNGYGNYHLRVQITQLWSAESASLLGEVKARFGGNVNEWTRGNAVGNRTLSYQANGDVAKELLVALRPHLRLKLEQADTAIAWQIAKPRLSRNANGTVRPRDADGVLEAECVSMLLKSQKKGATV